MPSGNSYSIQRHGEADVPPTDMSAMKAPTDLLAWLRGQNSALERLRAALEDNDFTTLEKS